MEMLAHYPSEYNEHISVRKNNRLLNWAANYGLRKRTKYVTRHKHVGRVLDIGCATGRFLDTLTPFGDWELYGVEPSPYAAKIARQNTLLTIYEGVLESTHFPNDYFDVITMWDVLEHVHNPLMTLQEIARILKPDGILVFRVPNYDSTQRKQFGKYWAGYEPPRHLYVFSPKILSQMLEKTNLTMIDWTTKSSNYLTFVLSIRFVLTGKGIKRTTREQILQWLNHPISRLAFAPFFYVGGIFEKGPLLVVTAQRQV